MKFTILTLFPQMFQGPFDYSIVKRAREKGLIEINFIDIRDFGIGKHKMVDDTPYGGGTGMILKADVLKKAIDAAIDKKLSKKEQRIILTSAAGEQFNQKKGVEYSKLKHLIIVCGHYEGFDERIVGFVDEEISIGDFIVTGGEIPSMLITDAVSRLVEGVLKEGVTNLESFSGEENSLEYPQFTRPEAVDGVKVPEVLLSGNHAEINKWRKDQSRIKTGLKRKGLLKK